MGPVHFMVRFDKNKTTLLDMEQYKKFPFYTDNVSSLVVTRIEGVNQRVLEVVGKNKWYISDSTKSKMVTYNEETKTIHFEPCKSASPPAGKGWVVENKDADLGRFSILGCKHLQFARYLLGEIDVDDLYHYEDTMCDKVMDKVVNMIAILNNDPAREDEMDEMLEKIQDLVRGFCGE